MDVCVEKGCGDCGAEKRVVLFFKGELINSISEENIGKIVRRVQSEEIVSD